MQINYQHLFSQLEQSFQDFNQLSNVEFEKIYAGYKQLSYKPQSDSVYFNLLKLIPFYSGFKAVTVEKKIDVLHKYFPSIETAAAITEEEKSKMLEDQEMIKSISKINAVIHNAAQIIEIRNSFGSFHNYLESFKPMDSFENLLLLKEDLQSRFQYLGGITVYHFMTEIGLPVLKPDRVITRIFKRLGLILNEDALLATVIHGRKFAEATGYSIRYIDIILVKYGQQGKSEMLKVKDGICLDKDPKCSKCSVASFCTYKSNNHATAS